MHPGAFALRYFSGKPGRNDAIITKACKRKSQMCDYLRPVILDSLSHSHFFAHAAS